MAKSNSKPLSTRTVIQKIVIAPIKFYRYCLSPFLGRHCRFTPSCSVYAMQAIHEQGCGHGLWLAVRRICRCHPWHNGGYDPVPSKQLMNE